MTNEMKIFKIKLLSRRALPFIGFNPIRVSAVCRVDLRIEVLMHCQKIENP